MELIIDETSINWDLLESVFPTHKAHGLIKEFVQSIDPEIKVRMSGDEFYCIISQKLINVPFYSDSEGDRLFYDFVVDRFGESINPYLMGILHEVFHIATYDENLDKDRDILYFMLQLDFQNERYEEFTRMYFSIPSEFEATKGAVNYYLTHKDYCDSFIKQLEKGEWHE
jgi:hypothetical protein